MSAAPVEEADEAGVDLSTLVTLARIGSNWRGDTNKMVDALQTNWAKTIAPAIVDTERRKNLSEQQQQDLRFVRQLAGVEG